MAAFQAQASPTAPAPGAPSGTAYAQSVNGGWAYFDANGQLLGGAHLAQDGTVLYTDASGTTTPDPGQGAPGSAPAQSGPSGAAYAQSIDGGWVYFDANGQLVGSAEAGPSGTVIYRDANGSVSSVMQPAGAGMNWFDPQGNLYDITAPVGSWFHAPQPAPAPALPDLGAPANLMLASAVSAPPSKEDGTPIPLVPPSPRRRSSTRRPRRPCRSRCLPSTCMARRRPTPRRR